MELDLFLANYYKTTQELKKKDGRKRRKLKSGKPLTRRKEEYQRDSP
jgi:hypothetical protein